MKNIPIIIDGPNFINRVIDLKIDPLHISRQISLVSVRDLLNEKIKEVKHVSGHCETAEFYCSKRKFGPPASKFTDEQQKFMLDHFRGETGVYVDIVDIPGDSEKGVDMTISGRLEEYAKEIDAVILVSADKDFIPTLKKLRHKLKVILVALNDKFPPELKNEAYATIFAGDEYRSFFRYSYPQFSIRDFNENMCAILHSEADDRHVNQLRVTEDGYVLISPKGGLNDLDFIKFRFESFGPYNGYVGPRAASDKEYINKQYKELLLAWEVGAKGYIDYPVASVWGGKEKG